MGVHFNCDFERLERLVYSIGGNGDSSFECVQKIGMGPYTKSIPELVKNSTHSGRIIGIFKIDCEGCSSWTLSSRVSTQRSTKRLQKAQPEVENFLISATVERCVQKYDSWNKSQLTASKFIFDNQELLHFSMLVSLEVWVPLKRISCIHG